MLLFANFYLKTMLLTDFALFFAVISLYIGCVYFAPMVLCILSDLLKNYTKLIGAAYKRFFAPHRTNFYCPAGLDNPIFA